MGWGFSITHLQYLGTMHFQLTVEDCCLRMLLFSVQQAVQTHKLSKRWLRSLIDSREDHLGNKQFLNLEAVENYSEKSNSVLYYLVLQGLGV